MARRSSRVMGRNWAIVIPSGSKMRSCIRSPSARPITHFTTRAGLPRPRRKETEPVKPLKGLPTHHQSPLFLPFLQTETPTIPLHPQHLRHSQGVKAGVRTRLRVCRLQCLARRSTHVSRIPKGQDVGVGDMRQQNPPRKSRVCFKTSRQWRHLPKLTDSETTPRTNISQLILQKTPEIASKMTPRIECWAQQTSRASTSVKAEDDSKSDDDSLIDGFQDLVDDGVPTFVDDSQSEDEGEAGEQDYPRKRARVVTDESAEQWIDYNQTNHVPESDDEMQRFRDHLKLLIQSLCNWAGSDTDGPSKDWMKMHRSERAMTRGFRSALISTNRED